MHKVDYIVDDPESAERGPSVTDNLKKVLYSIHLPAKPPNPPMDTMIAMPIRNKMMMAGIAAIAAVTMNITMSEKSSSMPVSFTSMGFDAGRQAKLTDEEFAVIEQVRDKTLAKPVSLE